MTPVIPLHRLTIALSKLLAIIGIAVAAMLLGADPLSAHTDLVARARTQAHGSDYDRAIADLTKAIEQDPSDKAAYELRGICYVCKKEKNYDLARADFDAIIRLDPQNGRAYQHRGSVYYAQHQYANAKADFARAIALNPEDPRAYNSMAWLMATSPDSNYRDGVKAVELARKACEFSSWRLPSMIDTLAAAYAEDGKFNDAVAAENQALEKWSHWRNVDASVKAARERIALYEAGKPYHWIRE